MLKKMIAYEDFEGNVVNEAFFFHLSKAELVELEMSREGGLADSLRKIVETEDGKQIIAEFKNIILGAYGKKSDDNRRFIKNQQLRDEFESSEAYSVLFMELVTNAESAAEFVNGIVPSGMAEEVAKLKPDSPPSEPPVLEVVTEPEPELFTRAQVAAMSPEEYEAFRAQVKSGKATLAEE